jgi:hypothetical protein
MYDRLCIGRLRGAGTHHQRTANPGNACQPRGTFGHRQFRFRREALEATFTNFLTVCVVQNFVDRLFGRFVVLDR